jgi:hypothetical protein
VRYRLRRRGQPRIDVRCHQDDRQPATHCRHSARRLERQQHSQVADGGPRLLPGTPPTLGPRRAVLDVPDEAIAIRWLCCRSCADPVQPTPARGPPQVSVQGWQQRR